MRASPGPADGVARCALDAPGSLSAKACGTPVIFAMSFNAAMLVGSAT